MAKQKVSAKDRFTGVVKWFNKSKGFGFIVCDDLKGDGDIFVHYSAINGDGYKELLEGEHVEFNIKTSSKGVSALAVDRLGMAT
jgi:CspA family cold shock protein